MKTQIFRLESYDDVNSIRDRLSWAKATRILLVFPRRRPPKFTRLDLILIQRIAAQTGGQLALVTRDGAIIQLATELAIPVFPSILAAERLTWRSKPRLPLQRVRRYKTHFTTSDLRDQFKPQPVRKLPIWARITLFILGIIGFLALVLLFIPSASVVISLPRETQSINLVVYPEVGGDLVFPSGSIPATVLKTTVAGQMEADATGYATIPVESASALLTIKNMTDQPITIPAGAVFSVPGDPPTRFASRIPIKIDAGFEETGQVTVFALEPGTGGNVPSNSITLVEGEPGFKVMATNLEPASGGSDRRGLIASERDATKLYDSLVTSLIEDAEREFLTAYSDNLVLLSGTLKVENMLSEILQPEANSPADRVKLFLTIEVSGLAISRADLFTMASPAMDAAQPEGKTVLMGSYVFSNLTNLPSNEDGRLPWRIHISRSLVQDVRVGDLLTSIQGKNVQSAVLVLQNRLNLMQPALIEVFPAWWPRLPFIPFRIEVEWR